MGALIEKYEEGKSAVLAGGDIQVNGDISQRTGQAEERISIWFNHLEKYPEKSIFSIVVEIAVYAPKNIIHVKTQTDFYIYPYADLSYVGVGGLNEPKFVNMLSIAQKYCMSYAQKLCDKHGLNNIAVANNPRLFPEVIEPISGD